MNSNEIRVETAGSARDAASRELSRCDSGTTSIIVFLGEIAAQLAESNEFRKPRWVEFKMENDPVMIDANGVRSVWSFGEKNMCRICFSHDSTGGQIVQEGYESVCAKLGIEVSR